MPKLIDLTGKRFGRLVVLEKAGRRVSENGNATIMWKCKCDCGNVVEIRGASLRNGNTRSCGCFIEEKRSEFHKTHGDSYSKIYNIWRRMKDRCYNPNNNRYHRYGGRGITVCDEWLNDYNAFKKWAFENGFVENSSRKECSLDRIDSNGNYCPENCRWVNSFIQSNNKVDTIYLTYKDETHSLTEWSLLLNMSRGTLYNRLYLYKWPLEKAFETPVKHRKEVNAVG